MPRCRPSSAIALAAACLAVAAATGTAGAAEIWSGRTYSFTRMDGVSWTLRPNQDSITAKVRITRGDLRGIFNIAQEPAYSSDSPRDTEWAFGDAVDYANLSFQPWVVWTGSTPPAVVGADAVVHLKSDDIYIDIRFDNWTIMAGGGFSYTRAVRGTPVPSLPVSWGRVKALFR